MPVQPVIRRTTHRDQAGNDRDYWGAQTPEARIAAVTFMVNTYYGLDDEVPARFQGPVTVAKRPLR